MKTAIVVVWAVAALAETVPGRLTLAEAIAIAERANPDVQIARLRALEADAVARQTRAALGPQLSILGSGSYQTSSLAGIGLNDFGFPARIGPYRLFDARPRLTQSAFDLSLHSSARAARLRAEAADADAAVIAESTRLLVIQLYLQALEAESRQRAAEARRGTAEASLRQARAGFEAGTVNRIEVTRAEQQVERENTLAIRARRDRQNVVPLLLQTLGFAPVENVELSPLPVSHGEGTDRGALLTAAARQRPEMKALQTRELALGAEKQRAQRERLPKVQAVGDFGAFGQDPTRSVSTWFVGGSVTLPLWTSGRIENEIRAAGIRLQIVSAEKRKLENRIATEIAQALAEHDAAERELDSAARALEAAKQTLVLERMRSDAGLNTTLHVVTATNEVAAAEEERIRATYHRLRALAELAHARGDTLGFLLPH
jgi:outer membrane protein, multidrug efflux system